MRSSRHMGMMLAALLSMPENLKAEAAETDEAERIAGEAVKDIGNKVITGKWMPDTINQGRNAAKRARRAINKSYDGPAKTPKGRRGK